MAGKADRADFVFSIEESGLDLKDNENYRRTLITEVN